jgi:hypothetical protein
MNIKSGDIFLIDSDKTGAKMVKFLQTAPTVWQHLWRTITKKQEVVKYYHAGCFLNPLQIIEQQSKVRIKESDDVLASPNPKCFISCKLATEEQRTMFQTLVIKDVGLGYDVLNIFGKTITWLTGIKWFSQHVESKNKEICINRIGAWYKEYFNEDFGVKHHSELTTHTMYKYIKSHPEKFDIIFEG